MTNSLESRMKDYEQRNRYFLQRKVPVILRIDGQHFHTFLKGFKKPFDPVFIAAMQNTLKYLCENIQGCVFGYTQSDEITLVLIDYANIDSDCWFNYRVDKLCSIGASMATMAFNKYFKDCFDNWMEDYWIKVYNGSGFSTLENDKLYVAYSNAAEKGATFDCRCFNLPKEEVVNCIIWRQNDASKNSILSVGQANIPHKEMQGLKCNDIQNKLLTEYNINWNDFSTVEKRGTCCIKKEQIIDESVKITPINFKLNGETIKAIEQTEVDIITRKKWVIDKEIPIISEDKDYVNMFVLTE